jgi:uncharacterized membrane protein YcaP (DUF421 family)
MDLSSIDWGAAFRLSVPPAEMILRGSVVYLFLFSFMRFVLKREGGSVSLADLLLTVLVADAAQNAMSAEYKSVTDGLILVTTLFFWNYTIDSLSFRFKLIRRLVQPAPVKLVEDGRMVRRNMRRELITTDELMSHIRESGAEKLDDIAAAYLEPDGHISVIRRDE